MNDLQQSRRLVRGEDLDQLVFDAVDRSLQPYRPRLTMGTLVRVRAAIQREVCCALRAGGDGRGAASEGPAHFLPSAEHEAVEFAAFASWNETDPLEIDPEDLAWELERELARSLGGAA